MAATIDDLLYVATALRVDIRSGFDDVVRAVGGNSTSGGGGGSAAKAPAAGGIGKAADLFLTGLNKAAVGLGTFQTAFSNAIGAMGQQMTRFVQLANPAAVLRFNMAVENAMSALGRVLVPVLERFTILIQKLGNAIESLSGPAKQLLGGLLGGSGLAGALGAVFSAGIVVVRLLGGWVTVLVSLAGALAGVFATTASGKQVAGAFNDVLKKVGTIFESVTALFGDLLKVGAPGLQAWANILGSLVNVLGAVLRVAMPLVEAALVPLTAVLTALAQVVESVLVPVLEGLAAVIKRVADFIAGAVKKMLAALGLASSEAAEYDPNAKTAQATRQSNITDLRSFANRNYTLAYGGAADVPKATLEEAKKQSGLLGQIYTALLAKNAGYTGNPLTAPPAPESRGTFGRARDFATQATLAGPLLAMNVMRSLFD